MLKKSNKKIQGYSISELFPPKKTNVKKPDTKQQPFQLDYRTLKPNYGVTDFENNKEVIRDAESFRLLW